MSCKHKWYLVETIHLPGNDEALNHRCKKCGKERMKCLNYYYYYYTQNVMVPFSRRKVGTNEM